MWKVNIYKCQFILILHCIHKIPKYFEFAVRIYHVLFSLLCYLSFNSRLSISAYFRYVIFKVFIFLWLISFALKYSLCRFIFNFPSFRWWAIFIANFLIHNKLQWLRSWSSSTLFFFVRCLGSFPTSCSHQDLKRGCLFVITE